MTRSPGAPGGDRRASTKRIGVYALVALAILGPSALSGLENVLATIAFFALLAVVFVVGRALLGRVDEPVPVGQGAAQVRAGTLPLGAVSLEGLVIRPARGVEWIRVVLFGGLAAFGAAIAVAGALASFPLAVVGGGLGSLVFAAACVPTVIDLRNGGSAFVLGDDALSAVTGGRVTVLRWDDVTTVNRPTGRGSGHLVLHGPGERYGPRLLTLFPQGLGTISIPLSMVAVDPEWLEGVVRRCVADPNARREVARGAVLPH